MNYLTDEEINALVECEESVDCQTCPVYKVREKTELLCFQFVAEQLQQERERYKQAEETIGILQQEINKALEDYDKLLTYRRST